VTFISMCEVYKRYATAAEPVHALRGVSFRLAEGALCAVVGPSGSGKSTLLALLGGLDVPTAGEVYVDAFALHRMTATARARFRAARVGFVFQANNLIPVLTAAENVALPLALDGSSTGERARRVDAVLDDLGVRDVAGHRPGELSGGQQQRVGIARALVTEPALVLADEPTAHLDSATGGEVMRILQEANRARGTTFVFSTHDPKIMAEAEMILTVEDGKVRLPAPKVEAEPAYA